MTYLKISTFRSGLYGKSMKVSCIGTSDEIKEKYESMHMKKTKVKTGACGNLQEMGLLLSIIFSLYSGVGF